MLIPFFVQFIYGEKNSIFLSSASVTAFIGILLVLTNLEENRKINLQQAFLTNNFIVVEYCYFWMYSIFVIRSQFIICRFFF